MTDMVPMHELVNTTDTYICSRNLFSFVNRSLNAMGLQAKILNENILPIDDFPVRFTVGALK